MINNQNIKKLVKKYVDNKKSQLPKELKPILIGDWDVSAVTDMSDLFTPFYISNADFYSIKKIKKM